MGAEINIGVPIKTHGPWPDFNRMFVGFAFSDYITKEDIPVDLRFRDMIVFENTVDGVKEFHLKGSTADESYVDKTKLDDENYKSKLAALEAYGSFYAYDKAIPFNIVKANTYHPLCTVTADDFIAGYGNQFAFVEGRIVDSNILAEADNGGYLLITCSAAHGLSNNDLVVLMNMNNAGHDKPTRISVVDSTSFICDDIVYVAGAGTSSGVVTQPAYLEAGISETGIFLASFNINGAAAAANKTWKWELNINVSPVDSIVSERYSTNTIAALTASGLISIEPNDRIWISGKNITDTSDYTIKHMNLNIHKI